MSSDQEERERLRKLGVVMKPRPGELGPDMNDLSREYAKLVKAAVEKALQSIRMREGTERQPLLLVTWVEHYHASVDNPVVPLRPVYYNPAPDALGNVPPIPRYHGCPTINDLRKKLDHILKHPDEFDTETVAFTKRVNLLIREAEGCQKWAKVKAALDDWNRSPNPAPEPSPFTADEVGNPEVT
jgi:hypothetical protein